MKKYFKIFVLLIASLQLNAQHFSGTSNTTSDIFRSGRTSIGYTGFPSTLSNYNLLVNSRAFFNERVRFRDFVHVNDNSTTLNIITSNTWNTKLMLGDYLSFYDGPDYRFYLKSEGGIYIRPKTEWLTGASIKIDRQSKPTAEGGAGTSFIQLAIASCDGCYSNNSKEGDMILRGVSGYYNNGNIKNIIVANEGYGQIKFSTKTFNSRLNEIRMSITNEGNVGIGIENPTDRLEVNGTIHAKEVRVDLQGWPDYVFEENYQLPTIEEVEAHIREKGHLPNVPSATEIEANGLKLSEINKKLMEKIEELTLYIIDLNNKVKVLENSLNNQYYEKD